MDRLRSMVRDIQWIVDDWGLDYSTGVLESRIGEIRSSEEYDGFLVEVSGSLKDLEELCGGEVCDIKNFRDFYEEFDNE